MSGVVYCLTNPAMSDYVKIGRTTNLVTRLRQLDNTSVPLPFEVVYAVEVDNPEEVERPTSVHWDVRAKPRYRQNVVNLEFFLEIVGVHRGTLVASRTWAC